MVVLIVIFATKTFLLQLFIIKFLCKNSFLQNKLLVKTYKFYIFNHVIFNYYIIYNVTFSVSKEVEELNFKQEINKIN